MKRAANEYRVGELNDASDSIAKAESSAPDDPEVRILAARIALARLDFKRASKALQRVDGSEAASLRARAYWYSDDLPHAAEELSRALEDPDFKDPWAKPVRELAGQQGAGRHPFTMKEGASRLVELKMPRDLYPALMIPVEIDGTTTLAIVASGVPEVVLDSKARTGPSWVAVRFASGDKSIELRDVPALTQDLSAFTSGQNVPIGALIGVNLLRRLHPTFDRRADQFIVRREDPPPPAAMTRVPVTYVRGGGMVVRGTLRKEFEIASGFWVDTGSPFRLALPDSIWKKVGVDPKSLTTHGGYAVGRLFEVRVGALNVGPVDAVAGVAGMEEKLQQLDIDAAGALGVQFLTALRVTLADGGRSMWLETDEDTSNVLAPTAPPPGPAGTAGTASAGTPAAAPSSSGAPTLPKVAPGKPAPAPKSSTAPASRAAPAASAGGASPKK